MNRRQRFLALAHPILCPLPLPFPTGPSVVTVTADPRESPAGTCLWWGRMDGWVKLGGDMAQVEITVNVTIKGSRKWE